MTATVPRSVEQLEGENAALVKRVQELLEAAERWHAVRIDVTRFYKLYSHDERFDRVTDRGLDVGQVADQAADRMRA